MVKIFAINGITGLKMGTAIRDPIFQKNLQQDKKTSALKIVTISLMK